jgi:oxygen-dependent protoporphyrinogen oxidase
MGAAVAVVGGGISGLTAAWELIRADPTLQITVLDAGDEVGGKLRRATVAGVSIDVGAESMLARRPEAVGLVEELGLADRLVHPEPVGASIWSRGRLHPMPKGTLMGVPASPGTARGLLSDDEVARAESEAQQRFSPIEQDLSVGDFVAGRVGDAVVDRLVEPLLGGVYAGHARQLSLHATVAPLWQAATRGDSLLRAAERAAVAAVGNQAPVFAGLVGGIAVLPQRLAELLSARGVRIESGAIVRRVERTPSGWRVVAGPVPAPVAWDVDGVVLATPAAPAARLLRDHAPLTADALAQVDYASMAIVTLALPAATVPDLPGSGFLVPPVEGHTIKAATFSAAKWRWVADAGAEQGVVLLRVSIGRHGEVADLQRPDEELVARARRDLSEALGVMLPAPVDSRVQRWGGGLPQYAVGHVERVATIRDGVADLPGLEVCGAAYDGVGIPACIGSGRSAAETLLTHLRSVPATEGQ